MEWVLLARWVMGWGLVARWDREAPWDPPVVLALGGAAALACWGLGGGRWVQGGDREGGVLAACFCSYVGVRTLGLTGFFHGGRTGCIWCRCFCLEGFGARGTGVVESLLEIIDAADAEVAGPTGIALVCCTHARTVISKSGCV